MADDQEKTEEPTPKRVEDERQKGNVAKSSEIVGLAILLMGTIYILFFADSLVSSVKTMFFHTWNSFENTDITNNLSELAVSIVYIVLYATLPILALVFIMAILGNTAQFGFLVTSIKLKFEKIDPIKGFKNVFSMKKFVELLKLTLKIILVIIVMGILFYFNIEEIIGMSKIGFEDSLNVIQQQTVLFLGTIVLIVAVFAIADLFFVRHHHSKSLKMSIQEIKDEFKQVEGDPHVKSRIKQIQHNMSRQRAMAEVPNADVVLTNPTHYAVALKYEKEKHSAPKVIAKGTDVLAHQIKKIAIENDVPIIENPPLARALYAQVEVDQLISEDFYKAIAEVFIYLYELKEKGK